MRIRLTSLFNDQSNDFRYKVIGLYVILFAYTSLVWLWAYYALHDNPFLFSTAILAYTFGLRHAVDADHIAAIDNVTRKLMQEGKKPISLGLFFSLGHSTIVVIATIVVAVTTFTLMNNAWHRTAGVICTSISAVFLLLIAMINLFIFFSIWKTFKHVRQGKNYNEEAIETLIDQRGFLSRYFRAFFRLVTKSWHMYFIGFLFGIGFDTATEIALLGIAASQTLNGMSTWTILVFPALFTAGMTLVDTTDCILMLGAYGWAFLKPIRKLYYNLTITFVSVVVALFIGSMEALGLIVETFHAKGWLWDAIQKLNAHLSDLGYYIILLFIVCWFISAALYKYLNIEAVPGRVK